MSDLILSINSKILKITNITNKGEFKGITKEIPNNICADSEILNAVEFSSFLEDVLKEFLPNGYKKHSLTFLLEPESIYSEFIELPQTEEEEFDAVIEKAKHQLEGVDLNELYFTHTRLAPFIRHFIGVKKVILDNYLQIAQSLNMELKSIIPWNFLLPKFANVLEPSLFVVINDNETIFSLSEFNNIYFSKAYSRKFKAHEIEDYVHELSNYERTSQIKKIFFLGREPLKIGEPYEVVKISLPNSSVEETHGFEHHLLTHYMLDFDDSLATSNLNTLSLLPLPTTVKNSSALVYAGAALSVLLLLAGVVYGGIKLNNSTNSQLANNPAPTSPTVAGVDTTNVAPTNPVPAQIPSGTEPKPEEKKPLERKDLSVMIQNGAGTAGLASKTKIFLEELGYKIYDIGDAELTGRENTLLKFKKDKYEYKDMVKNDIKDKYLDVVAQDDLDPSAKYDLLIIVGTKVNDL